MIMGMTFRDDWDPISMLREERQKNENKISELKRKVNELKNICFFYTEEIYRFIANFRQDNLDPKQKDSLDKLRQIADDCIEDDRYKSLLFHKYIAKDYYVSVDSDEVKNATKAAQEELYSNLEDSCEEEDESPLVNNIKD